MGEKRFSRKQIAEWEGKVDSAIMSILDGKELRRPDSESVAKYEFSRSEVLPENSHRAINRMRNLAAVVVGASSATWSMTLFELVTLDMDGMMVWGAGGITTSVITSLIYGKVLPRMNSKVWVNGTNSLLQQVLLSRSVNITEEDLLEPSVKKPIGGGGYVLVKTKKNKARKAGPNDIVGSVEIKYPSEHENEFDTVFQSVLTNDPDVAKAVAAVEKKQLPAAKPANTKPSKWSF